MSGAATEHRRRVNGSLLAIAVLAGALVAGAAPAAGQTIPGADCGSATTRWLFWPKGHRVVRSQNFPAFATPHLEVYSGVGKKFPDDQQIAYADPTTAETADTCTSSEISPGTEPTTKSTTKPKQLVCTFPSNAVFLAAPNKAGGTSLIAYVGGEAAVVATVAETGSKLQFDGAACKLKKLPK